MKSKFFILKLIEQMKLLTLKFTNKTNKIDQIVDLLKLRFKDTKL